MTTAARTDLVLDHTFEDEGITYKTDKATYDLLGQLVDQALAGTGSPMPVVMVLALGKSTGRIVEVKP